MGKAIKIIKNRSDIGAGTRGSDLGIDAMEIAAINKGSQFFNQVPFVDVETRNQAVYSEDHHPFAKRIKQVFDQCSSVAGIVGQSLSDDFFPVVFSGDHSSAIGTISAIHKTFNEKKLGVIWIDAHADIHSPFTTPSGNMHGMSLAAALQQDNMECCVNEVGDETINFWTELKNIVGKPVQPEHLVYIGVRDTEGQEDYLLEKLGIKNFKVEEIRYRGIETCINHALQQLTDCELIYISLDVDSMDCELISHGTGTPVPKGLDQNEVVEILQHIFVSKKVVCFELVEVNPLLDNKGNKMAEVAFGIVENLVPLLEN